MRGRNQRNLEELEETSGVEEVVIMSTRKLIGLSLIVGLAILVAGTVQLLMIVG